MKKLLFFLCLSSSLSLLGEGVMEVWGYDAALAQGQKETPLPASPPLSVKVPQKMIRFFQHYISPIDGPRSSYLPTSSQYALEAIGKHGFLKGVALGCDRLMRENGYLWVYKTRERDGVIRKLDPVRDRILEKK